MNPTAANVIVGVTVAVTSLCLCAGAIGAAVDSPAWDPSPTPTRFSAPVPTNSDPSPTAAPAEKRPKKAPKKAAGGNPLVRDIKALDVESERRGGYDREKFGDYDRPGELADNFDAWPKCDGYFSRYDKKCYSVEEYGSKAKADDEVDIDHLVALAEAWDSGAHAWDSDELDEFAGYSPNLNVMTDTLNQSVKSDRDAAEWQPDHYRCQWVQTYVEVKTDWNLSVDRAERTALFDAAKGCDQ